MDGKVDIETCGECNNQIMDELQKRLTKIEDDTNAFKTAIEAFGQDDQVSLLNDWNAMQWYMHFTVKSYEVLHFNVHMLEDHSIDQYSF